MLTVSLSVVGSIKQSEKYFSDACDEYVKRLGGYCRVKLAEFPDDRQTGARLLSNLNDRAYKVALCVEGKELSSEELAALIENKSNGGCSELDFVIGGSDGLPENVKSACDFRLSFSKMTFPHRLMRVILLEQLYRAFTINSGEKYHK